MVNQKREDDLERIIRYKLPLFDQKVPIILFWTPKSGCTTIIKWFFFQSEELEKALEYNSWVHEYYKLKYINNATHKNLVYWYLLHAKKDTYKLVRNPYRRAVSAFLMLVNDFEPYWQEVWGTIREQLFNNRNSTQGLSFREFLLYLKKMGADSPSLDPHFGQQYIMGEEKFINQYIYLENFNEQIAAIEDKYGLRKSNSGELSDSPHNMSSSMVFEGDYSNVNILDPSFPLYPSYKSFYNLETKRLVEEIFKDDFEKYGYKMDE
ncbi:sulfotransferase family 2 domain-containing protein [Bacillus gobiensis]|uniref:sulfotransferase family 2 domain-containing protein n=1 Tax=Bacillus gobiensis TaxID=1441095 RepID=UPI003D21EC7F